MPHLRSLNEWIPFSRVSRWCEEKQIKQFCAMPKLSALRPSSGGEGGGGGRGAGGREGWRNWQVIFFTHVLLSLFDFIRPLVPSWASRGERAFCLRQVWRPGWVGYLWVFSVSFTSSIQVFLGLPLALYPDIFVLQALLASRGAMSVRCPNHLILCCWMWWRTGVVPTISLILVFLILSRLILLTALLRHRICQAVIFLSRLLVRVHVCLW